MAVAGSEITFVNLLYS